MKYQSEHPYWKGKAAAGGIATRNDISPAREESTTKSDSHVHRDPDAVNSHVTTRRGFLFTTFTGITCVAGLGGIAAVAHKSPSTQQTPKAAVTSENLESDMEDWRAYLSTHGVPEDMEPMRESAHNLSPVVSVANEERSLYPDALRLASKEDGPDLLIRLGDAIAAHAREKLPKVVGVSTFSEAIACVNNSDEAQGRYLNFIYAEIGKLCVHGEYAPLHTAINRIDTTIARPAMNHDHAIFLVLHCAAWHGVNLHARLGSSGLYLVSDQADFAAIPSHKENSHGKVIPTYSLVSRRALETKSPTHAGQGGIQYHKNLQPYDLATYHIVKLIEKNGSQALDNGLSAMKKFLDDPVMRIAIDQNDCPHIIVMTTHAMLHDIIRQLDASKNEVYWFASRQSGNFDERTRRGVDDLEKFSRQVSHQRIVMLEERYPFLLSNQHVMAYKRQ